MIVFRAVLFVQSPDLFPYSLFSLMCPLTPLWFSHHPPAPAHKPTITSLGCGRKLEQLGNLFQSQGEYVNSKLTAPRVGIESKSLCHSSAVLLCSLVLIYVEIQRVNAEHPARNITFSSLMTVKMWWRVWFCRWKWYTGATSGATASLQVFILERYSVEMPFGLPSAL